MGLWGRLTGLGTGITEKEIAVDGAKKMAARYGVDVSEVHWVTQKTDYGNKIDYFINPEILNRKRELQRQREEASEKKAMEAEEMRRTGREACDVCGETHSEHTVTNLGHVFKSPSSIFLPFQCDECEGITECNNECNCCWCPLKS